MFEHYLNVRYHHPPTIITITITIFIQFLDVFIKYLIGGRRVP